MLDFGEGEKLMKTLRKIWTIIEDVAGVYFASVAFVLMFIAFCVQIIFRYILNFQFDWTYECTVIGFMWATAFGACYSSKINDHVSFNLIYEKFGEKGRAIMDILGNLIILAAFLLLVFPTVDYVRFMSIKATPVLKMKFSILYAPFIPFLVFSACYVVRNIYRAARVLTCVKREARNGGETGEGV